MLSMWYAKSIDIEVSLLAIGFQKVCIIRLPQHHPVFCVAYSTSTGTIIQTVYLQVLFNLPADQSVRLFAKTYQILDTIGL